MTALDALISICNLSIYKGWKEILTALEKAGAVYEQKEVEA